MAGPCADALLPQRYRRTAAFILLKQLSPEGYAGIAYETWKKWAPVIVGLPRRLVIEILPKSPEFSRTRSAKPPRSSSQPFA